jgi:hypothetical protein
LRSGSQLDSQFLLLLPWSAGIFCLTAGDVVNYGLALGAQAASQAMRVLPYHLTAWALKSGIQLIMNDVCCCRCLFVLPTFCLSQLDAVNRGFGGYNSLWGPKLPRWPSGYRHLASLQGIVDMGT